MDKVKAVKQTLWVTLGLNVISSAAKLIVGVLTGTLSLVAGGIDSAFDTLSNVIGLVGVNIAAQPADDDHPYGHHKAETMTAFIMATFLFLSAWELGKGAIEQLLHPELITAEVNIWSFGTIILSIIINQIIVMYELRVGRKVKSEVLIADASNKRADVIMSISLLVGLFLIRAGLPLADPILALLVALLIVRTGVEIIRENSPTLMDKIAIPEEEIRQLACDIPGVITCHRVRSRGNGDAVYVDMHIQVDPQMGIEQAHALSHRVQDRLRTHLEGIADVTVHAEPAEGVERTVNEDAIIQGIQSIAGDLQLMVHDVRLYQHDGIEYVSLHAEVDGQQTLVEAHAGVTELEKRIKQRFASVAEVVVHMEPLIVSSQPKLSEEEIRTQIVAVGDSIAGQGNTHHIELWPYNQGWYASLHCVLPDTTTLQEAHATSAWIEHLLTISLPCLEMIIVHMEPESDLD